jgi:ESCRT-I complex subunit VPS37
MRITGFDAIQSDEAWKNCRMTLGQVVHEVVKHLQLNPPNVMEITDAGLQAIQTSNSKHHPSHQRGNSSSTGTYTSSRTTSGSDNNYNDDAPPDYSTVLSMPEVPSQFEELDKLSREDLEELLEDELEFMTLVNKLPVFQKIQSTADKVLEENVTMAKANLEQEETIQTLHKEVTELKSQLETKIDKFRKLEGKQDSICAPPDTRDVLRQLNRAKKEALEESEQLAAKWVEDGGNVEAFVKSFMKKQTVHHLRAAKMEQIQQFSSSTKSE